MLTAVKTCLSCQRSLKGRSDKKFCNDYCRNTHNNQLNSDSNNYVRNIHHSLLKNRRILQGLFASAQQITECSKQSLHNKGFSFSYFTHTQTNKKGNTYCFCYEYGYMVVNGEKVVVVKRRE